MQKKIASPPPEYSPKGFINRDETLKIFSKAIQDGNCLLVGMPKVGKTWLLRKLEEHLNRPPKVIVIYVDCHTLKSFSELYSHVLTLIGSHDESLLGEVTKTRLTHYQMITADDILSVAVRAKQEGANVYLLVDHFPGLTGKPADQDKAWEFVHQFEEKIAEWRSVSYVLAGDFRLYRDVLRYPLLAQLYGAEKHEVYALTCLDRSGTTELLQHLKVAAEEQVNTAWCYTGGHPYLLYVGRQHNLYVHEEREQRKSLYKVTPEIYATLMELWQYRKTRF